MKLGISSYSFSYSISKEGWGYTDVCKKAKELGFDGIEFVGRTFFKEREEDEAIAREIRAFCEEIGLEIVAYTVGANLLDEDIEKQKNELFHCIDIAAILGAPLLRHDAAFSLKSLPGYRWQDGIVDMAPVIREITEYAAARGIRTCTENHGLIYQAPDRVERLIRTVNHPNYGWLVDVGNFLCADADPVQALITAAPYAFHVHVKDFLFKSGKELAPEGFMTTAGGNYLRGTVPGHGIVPIPQCLNILKKSGYDGYVSLEFEGLEQNIKALELGAAYLKRVLENK